ncbi:MAG: TauD/TfdA family dioxygenase [Alphaproteobacteria bacterium]|nr:TauD/TfdA family dioxygenase [Alphaproteobacteria bacterium]
MSLKAPADAYRRIGLRPVSGALGAVVDGVDLTDLDEAAFAAVHRALAEHLVLFFPGQALSREQQKALTRRFGPVQRVPFVAPMADDPDVIAVLKEADETRISVFGGDWHSDFSCLERPPMATLLYAVEVPPFGGDTIWADMRRAYAALSAGMQRLLAPLAAVHTGRPYGTKARLLVDNPARSIRISRGDPAADLLTPHPIVRRDPDTGRRALFVNPIYTSHIDGFSETESRPLLDFLYRHATRPEFTCRHSWRAGDLAVWDNRATLHYAVNDYDGHRRLLHRTTVQGERPLGAG